MNRRVGIDAVQADERIEIESIFLGNVRERVAALDDMTRRHLSDPRHVGWIGRLDLDDGASQRR